MGFEASEFGSALPVGSALLVGSARDVSSSLAEGCFAQIAKPLKLLLVFLKTPEDLKPSSLPRKVPGEGDSIDFITKAKSLMTFGN